MAESTSGRKGRNDKGKYRKNKAVSVAKEVNGRRPDARVVEPLYSTYDAPKPEGAYFDEAKANAPIEWVESNLRHFEGRFAGKPFYLLDWQKRIFRELFGWQILNEDDEPVRLYRTAYVECPRKAGKSTLASAVALYLAYGDGENAPQVVFAATNRQQASLCYNIARHIIEANKELYDATAVYNSKAEMQLRDNPGGVLKPISADAKGLLGLNIHGLIFDELLTQGNRDLWDTLTTSSGTRNQPLLFAISTAGSDQQSVCFEQHELTRQIQEGTVMDYEFFGVVYGAPMDADWTDPEVWMRANPSLGDSVRLSFYEGKAQKAKAAPAEQNAFRMYYLSQWVGQETRYLPIDHWDACSAPVSNPAKRRAFAGLDLSATTDITALTVVAENAAGGLDVFSYPFLPDDQLIERERRDRAPYGRWATEGVLTLTAGRKVNYQAVKAKILQVAEEFELVDVGYDPWNSSQLIQELEDEGLTMVQIRQGYNSLSAPTKSLLGYALDHKLCHGGHSLLRWAISNLAVSMDPAGNVKPDKAKATQRIDPVVALIMALDGYNRRGKETKRKSAYSAGGFYDQFMPQKESLSAA